MRPGERGKIQAHRLRILDLRRGHLDGDGRGDVPWRFNHKGRDTGIRVRLRGCEMQGFFPVFPDGDAESVLDEVDPEGGHHLRGVGVAAGRRRGRGGVAAGEEIDVGYAAALLGGRGGGVDDEDGGGDDGLAGVRVGENEVRVIEDGLGDEAGGDEFGEVLR